MVGMDSRFPALFRLLDCQGNNVLLHDGHGRLIYDFHCSDPDKMYSDILADAVRRHKVDEEGRKEMCEQIRKIEEESRAEGRKEGRVEGRKEGRAEGRKEGRREGVVETLITLVCDGILSLKDAAERAGMTEDALRKRMPAGIRDI